LQGVKLGAKLIILLLEVTLQQALQSLAVASLVK
jgi:hypothetical protein